MSWLLHVAWSALVRSLERPIKCEKALLVTAHPDDEAMFFTPTLSSLAEASCETRLLCLSKGWTGVQIVVVRQKLFCCVARLYSATK